jgi:hypothetical protein
VDENIEKNILEYHETTWEVVPFSFLNFSIKSVVNLYPNISLCFKGKSRMGTKLPECGISVEMANYLFTLLDFLKKVSLTRDFSVFPMSFRKPFLIWREVKYTCEIFLSVPFDVLSGLNHCIIYFVAKLILSCREMNSF